METFNEILKILQSKKKELEVKAHKHINKLQDEGMKKEVLSILDLAKKGKIDANEVVKEFKQWL